MMTTLFRNVPQALVRICTLAFALAQGGLSGCCNFLDPGQVVYPPPPSIVCPDLPRPEGIRPADPQAKTDPAKSWSLDPQLIDLPTALRLADGQSPEIAVARERIREAMARQDAAELLWLPSLELGSSWVRHDGQIQRAVGEVFPTSRSSLFVGGGPALNLPLQDALFAPLAARQLTAARQAGAVAVANEQLLDVALAYIDLLQVYAELRINHETTQNAVNLLTITENYEKAGKGAAADTARSRTEVYRRERQRLEIEGKIGQVSARLVQLLQIAPQVWLHPVDPAVVPIALVPEEMPLADLLSQAIANRPELAENRATLAAVVEIWRAAKLAPLVPTLRLSYGAGGFGGGVNEFFGDFDGRGDFAATIVWQLQNFGLGNQAMIRERHSQFSQAAFRQASIEARVASQVVSTFSVAFARRQELASSQREVAAARESYRLNEDRVRRAPEQGRPIELLQAVQALAQARLDYLTVVADYNRAQFRLYTALGSPPACALEASTTIPTSEPTVPPKAPLLERINLGTPLLISGG
jgi:outer membrane protein TolC